MRTKPLKSHIMYGKIERCFDYEALTAVWLESVRATHGFLSEEDIEFYHDRIPSSYMPCVELYAARDSRGAWCAFIGLSEDMVEMLFVRPDVMRMGYGTMLLGFATEEKGIRKVDVNEQNTGALAFYKRHGFTASLPAAVNPKASRIP